MDSRSTTKEKRWSEKISRTGYFVGVLLFHLIVFILVATWVVFPAFHPPPELVTKTYLLPAAKPTPPVVPTQPTVDLSDRLPTSSAPAVIVSLNNPDHFTMPVSVITPQTVNVGEQLDRSPRVAVKPNGISPERLKRIKAFMKASTGRSDDDFLTSDNDARNINKAKFVVYLASYADGDWGCNVITTDGKLVAGSLPNFIAKIGEWSHGRITAQVMPTPLNIGGPDLRDKAPPMIFFTGHKDFVLTDQEVQNLRDYLEEGGLIWGDNAEPGRGSRFDVAFRREMKRVVPDVDKNFEPVDLSNAIFTSWYPISKIPEGMNYYAEPLEHLDIDGKLAILYTPNDYSDMFCMRILPGDTEIGPTQVGPDADSPLVTSELFLDHSDVFFRNFKLPSCLACDQLGMNVIGYMLVRFDPELQLTP